MMPRDSEQELKRPCDSPLIPLEPRSLWGSQASLLETPVDVTQGAHSQQPNQVWGQLMTCLEGKPN